MILTAKLLKHKLVYNSFATAEFRETIGFDQKIEGRNGEKRLVNDIVDVAVFRVIVRLWRVAREVCIISYLSDNEPLRSPGAQVVFRAFRHAFNKPMGVELGPPFQHRFVIFPLR